MSHDEDAQGIARAAVELADNSDLDVDEALAVLARAARLLESADIVRDIVAKERHEPLDHTDHCIWCGADRRRLPVHEHQPYEPHNDMCPWRRAVEWVTDTGDQT